jgi:prefoldin subunit 5
MTTNDSDIAALKVEMSYLKRDIATLQGEIEEMRADIKTLMTLLNQAKGVKWLLIGLIALSGGIGAFVAKMVPFIHIAPKV